MQKGQNGEINGGIEGVAVDKEEIVRKKRKDKKLVLRQGKKNRKKEKKGEDEKEGE